MASAGAHPDQKCVTIEIGDDIALSVRFDFESGTILCDVDAPEGTRVIMRDAYGVKDVSAKGKSNVGERRVH